MLAALRMGGGDARAAADAFAEDGGTGDGGSGASQVRFQSISQLHWIPLNPIGHVQIALQPTLLSADDPPVYASMSSSRTGASSCG